MLPRPGGLEMNLTDGSPWPTYVPLSSNRRPSRAHRLPIVVLPEGSPEHTTDMRTPAPNPGDGPCANRPELISRALQTSYYLAELFVNLYQGDT